MAKAVYIKGRKACVVNRAVRVGTSTGEADCVCGGGLPCCIDGYTGCYPTPGVTTVALSGTVTAQAVIVQFQQPPVIYNASLTFTGSPVLLTGVGANLPCALSASVSGGTNDGAASFLFRRSRPSVRVDVPPYYSLGISIQFGIFNPVGAVTFWDIDALLPGTTPTTHFRRRVQGDPGWAQVVQVPYATAPVPPCYTGLRMVDSFLATRTADGSTLSASIDVTMTLAGASKCVQGYTPGVPPGMGLDSAGHIVPLWSLRGCCD